MREAFESSQTVAIAQLREALNELRKSVDSTSFSAARDPQHLETRLDLLDARVVSLEETLHGIAALLRPMPMQGPRE